MGLELLASYSNMTENCNEVMFRLLKHLEDKNAIGGFHLGTTVNSILDGTGTVIFSRDHGSFTGPYSLSCAHLSLKPQIFATESNSTNFSLEVFRYKNKVPGGGWLLSKDRTDDIIVIVYVRDVSENLQAKVDRYISGKVFSSYWKKKYTTALALADRMKTEDITEMDVVLLDRKSVIEGLSENGYPPHVLINEAKKVWKSGEKGKYPLVGFNRYDVQLSYNGRAPANQAETVALSTNIGFTINSKWVVGRYVVHRNENGSVQIEELVPFHFDWINHGKGCMPWPYWK